MIDDVLKVLDELPSEVTSSTRLLFANVGEAELRYLIPVARALRERGIACEIYPESSKLKKQFDYADKKTIPFISINGETEVSESKVNIKNLSTGVQSSFDKNDIDGVLAF